jgi:hypothetical protein
MCNHLSLCPVEMKIPLAYIVHHRVEVKDETTDNSAHGTRVYKIDNAKVHSILRTLCKNSREAVVTICPAKVSCDGQVAYFLLSNCYLGCNAHLLLPPRLRMS